MPESTRRPLLANGEKYISEIDHTSPGRPPELPRTYEAARDHIRWELTYALEHCAELPKSKRLGDELVLCLRLHPDMQAKSYDPAGLFAAVPDLANVGSRNYRVPPKSVAATKRIQKMITAETPETTGRLVFVRSTDAGFRRLMQTLEQPESVLADRFKTDIQRIEKFNLLSGDEQLQALNVWPNWSEGRVELILHPTEHSVAEQLDFLKHLFRDEAFGTDTTRVALYPDGLTFISCRLTRSALSEAAGAMPLRSAHPLVFGGLEDLRGAPRFPAPPPSAATTRSTIRMGLFDGGIDPTHPHLGGHCEQDEGLSIKTPPNPDYVAHGTAVAGVSLYGPLNGRDAKEALPAPVVSLVSVRVLPTSNPADVDLYECIEIIEAAVPARPDVKCWNLSFGPRGPITDDTVSRFSHALDQLAVRHKVTFCVAVGNDGEAGPDLSRIQSPSDLANGLGVGACTNRNGGQVHAPYSCRGPGRECAKLKPDLAAFGGCDQDPIHLLGPPGQKLLTHGTSFASPFVASLGARAAESFERGSALLGRALLIHTAKHPKGDPDFLLGHGVVAPDLDAILRCGNKDVTILFQGDLGGTEQIKLPLLLPPGVITGGMVRIDWTVAALSPVTARHPADYTMLCIEDTFYPNGEVYTFSPPKTDSKAKPRRLHVRDDAAEIQRYLAAGWKRSRLPVPESGNAYESKYEADQRRLNYKWEPIVRRSLRKQAGNLHEPFLVLHAIARHGALQRIDYAVVVTISAPQSTSDLYNAVRTRYTALQPIRVRNEIEVRVKI